MARKYASIWLDLWSSEDFRALSPKAQHYRYLLREEYFIRDGDRHNANPEMVRVIRPYAAADLEAVADYLAQLPPPGPTPP